MKLPPAPYIKGYPDVQRWINNLVYMLGLGSLVPSGGTAGQALAKVSATNFDVTWETVSTAPHSVISWPMVSLVGTNAAVSQITATKLPVPFASKVISAKLLSITGGTSAAWGILLQKSVAGTGAWTSFGTFNAGTCANNSILDATISGGAVTLAANDCICVAVPQGTVARYDSATFSLKFEEILS